MRVLYVATDQVVPGTLGGSIHVQAVAEGLAALGHEVHVATRRESGHLDARVHWHAIGTPANRPQLRLLRSRAVRSLALQVRPDAVIERYHNFGGEGILAARAVDVPAVLEVNAPIIDHEGSRKALVDRMLVVQPMKQWRTWQVEHADLILTPTAAIVPADVPRSRILELEWGADTEKFGPRASGPIPWDRQPGLIDCVFAGAFRAWHGAIQLVEAIRILHAQGRTAYRAVLIGDGPERPPAERAAESSASVIFTGAIPHERMPAALAAADIGVAPFDVSQHPALTLDFYWSPLKIFEYMASGLPVVAPAIARLQTLVARGTEGVLYEPATPQALAEALKTLDDQSRRSAMGAASRERAVRDYSWQAHCRALSAAIERLIS
jgi:glycosyltransferase involved in cell wall biosynthesis